MKRQWIEKTKARTRDSVWIDVALPGGRHATLILPPALTDADKRRIAAFISIQLPDLPPHLQTAPADRAAPQPDPAGN
jgi:hypothetical protein